MFFSVLSKLAVIFMLIAAGYAARRTGVLNAQLQAGLSRLVLTVATPALVLSSAGVTYTSDRMRGILLVLGCATLYYLVSIPVSHLTARAAKLSDSRRRAFVALSVFANVAFLGYPIIRIFLPETGVFYSVFFNIMFQLVLFTYGTAMMSRQKLKNPAYLLRDPNILSALVMIVLFAFQVKLPAPVQETISILGGLCTPLSMLVIGSMLAAINIKELFRDGALYLMSAMRLLVFPAVALILLRLFGVGAELATVIVMMAAMPSGATIAIIGEQYHCEPEMCSKGIVLSTLLSLLTIPLVGLAIGALFGQP